MFAHDESEVFILRTAPKCDENAFPSYEPSRDNGLEDTNEDDIIISDTNIKKTIEASSSFPE